MILCAGKECTDCSFRHTDLCLPCDHNCLNCNCKVIGRYHPIKSLSDIFIKVKIDTRKKYESKYLTNDLSDIENDIRKELKDDTIILHPTKRGGNIVSYKLQ